MRAWGCDGWEKWVKKVKRKTFVKRANRVKREREACAKRTHRVKQQLHDRAHLGDGVRAREKWGSAVSEESEEKDMSEEGEESKEESEESEAGKASQEESKERERRERREPTEWSNGCMTDRILAGYTDWEKWESMSDQTCAPIERSERACPTKQNMCAVWVEQSWVKRVRRAKRVDRMQRELEVGTAKSAESDEIRAMYARCEESEGTSQSEESGEREESEGSVQSEESGEREEILRDSSQVNVMYAQCGEV
jgi:hypothetical protein